MPRKILLSNNAFALQDQRNNIIHENNFRYLSVDQLNENLQQHRHINYCNNDNGNDADSVFSEDTIFPSTYKTTDHDETPPIQHIRSSHDPYPQEQQEQQLLPSPPEVLTPKIPTITNTISRVTQHTSEWNSKFNKLLEYKSTKGHTNVPWNNKTLGIWTGDQRSHYRLMKQNRFSCMTSDKITMLEAIGFEWDHFNLWDAKFDLLVKFKEDNGHTNVPRTNKHLGNWVKQQRVHYKQYSQNTPSNMSFERIMSLESLGFNWSIYDAWIAKFEQLKSYKLMNGHCNVPWKEPNLGRWVRIME